MLFDLRGRGRRRTVQAIYLMLAVLIGGGLVLFGIGGATNGGLVDAVTGKSGSTSASDTFQKQVDAARQRVNVRPDSVVAWRDLARAQAQLAGTGDDFDPATATFTSSGKAQLRQADTSFQRYLTLLGDNGKVDVTLANLMVNAYDPTVLNQPAKAVAALENVIDGTPPSSGNFGRLAVYAYEAGQTRKGDLASAKAVSLAPKAQQATVKASLAQAKASAASATGSSTAGTATTTTG
jgi:hypothetical protein